MSLVYTSFVDSCRLPLIRLPIEKPISLLSQKQDTINPILVGMTDPFLYNPRRASGGQVVFPFLFTIKAILMLPHVCRQVHCSSKMNRSTSLSRSATRMSLTWSC